MTSTAQRRSTGTERRGTGAGACRLDERTWVEVDAAPPVILVVPLGSCEQHGPHLPLHTDTVIAESLADVLIDTLAGQAGAAHMLVAPAITVTSSGEHAGFPGTLSIGSDVTERLVVELVRSADWSNGVVLVNGHGGNAAPVRLAVAALHAEGRRVLSWWPQIADGDAHGGHSETSLMLAIAPHLVHTDRAAVGRCEPVTELYDELRRAGVRAVSPNGVLGDPTGASAEHGGELLAKLGADLVAAVQRWQH